MLFSSQSLYSLERERIMNFCKECGEEIKSAKLKFCTNCGSPLSNEKATEQPAKPIKREDMKPKGAKKPMSKKKKRSIIIGGLAGVILIALFYVGSYVTSHERLTDQFVKAVQSKNADELADILSFRGMDEGISKKEATRFMEYLNKSPETAIAVTKSVKKQSKMMDGRQVKAADKEEWMEKFLSLVDTDLVLLEKGDGFLFYDTYELTLEPLHVELNSNLSGTEVFLDEESIGKVKEKDGTIKAGPFVPGVHTFKAVNKNEWTSLEMKQEATLIESGQQVSFPFEATYVKFDIPFKADLKSVVTINGEKKEFDIFNNVFGPVKTDGSVQMSVGVDFPWGKMSTKEVSIERETFPVIFKLDSKLKAKLEKALNHHVKDYMTSWKKNDITALDYLNTNLLNDYKYMFDNIHHDGDYHEIKLLGMNLDEQSLTVNYDAGSYFIEAIIKEDVRYADYDSKSEKESYEESNAFQYTFIYSDGKWKVIDKLQSFSGNFDEGMELDVSSQLYTIKGEQNGDGKTPDENTNNDASEGSKSAIEDTVINYIYGLVKAINSGDYDKARPYILEGSPLQESQTGLVERLYEDGLTEEVVNATVTNVEKGDGEWYVTTKETVKLNYESGDSETKSYEWTYTVEKAGGSFKLSNIK